MERIHLALELHVRRVMESDPEHAGEDEQRHRHLEGADAGRPAAQAMPRNHRQGRTHQAEWNQLHGRFIVRQEQNTPFRGQ